MRCRQPLERWRTPPTGTKGLLLGIFGLWLFRAWWRFTVGTSSDLNEPVTLAQMLCFGSALCLIPACMYVSVMVSLCQYGGTSRILKCAANDSKNGTPSMMGLPICMMSMGIPAMAVLGKPWAVTVMLGVTAALLGHLLFGRRTVPIPHARLIR